MNKKIIFWIISALGLLKIILLLATGSVFGIVYCSAWLAWFSLIIFAIFLWFFYRFAFKAMYSWKFIIIFLVVITVVIYAIGFSTQAIRFGGNASVTSSSVAKKSSVPELIKCSSTDTDMPISVDGFSTELFASPLDASRSFTIGAKTNTRVFSLADYANEKANPIKDFRNPVEKTTLKEDIFFDIHKSDQGFMPKVSGAIQLCDKNNNTLYKLDLDPRLTSESSTGATWYIHGSSLPKETGDYRVDAYLYANGKWSLTNRIDNITLTN